MLTDCVESNPVFQWITVALFFICLYHLSLNTQLRLPYIGMLPALDVIAVKMAVDGCRW